MRQAGRYMAEYRAIRKQYTLLEICKQPELAAEVTLQPINRLEIDAAILFSDLLLPLEPMGIPFDFIKGEGPVIHKPIQDTGDIQALRTFESRIISSRSRDHQDSESGIKRPHSINWFRRGAVHAG